MTADEIREKSVAKMPAAMEFGKSKRIDIGRYMEFSCLMLQEIAAQIAEANDLSRFEFGLDESHNEENSELPIEFRRSDKVVPPSPEPGAERIIPFDYQEVKTGTLPSTVLPHDFGTSQLGEANQPTEAPAALNTQARPPINPLRSKR